MTSLETADVCTSRHPYSVLIPMGFTLPFSLPTTRWALTPPFHPYLIIYLQKQTISGGLFSAALSLRSPSPEVIRHRFSMEPGLSSPHKPKDLQGAAAQPTDKRLTTPYQSQLLVKRMRNNYFKMAFIRWQYLAETGFIRLA
jgi:hypothetical protein